MPGGAILGSSILGIGSAVIGANAAKDAAGIQAGAAGKALKTQQAMFQQGQQALSPFQEVGKNAAYSLAQLYGLPTPNAPAGLPFGPQALEAFRQAPDYQFALNEGMRAIEYGRAANKQLQNPGTPQALMQFAQGFAGQRLTSYMDRLAQLAGFGLNAAQGQAGQATAQGQVIGNTIQQQGAAQASGVVGAANQYTGAMNQMGSNMALYGFMQPRTGGAPPGAGGPAPMLGGPAPSYPAGTNALNYPLTGSVPALSPYQANYLPPGNYSSGF
jgi:hypothetical protein